MSEFNNSKWDATNWTTEQKARWQEKCFELGYKWQSGKVLKHLDVKHYYLDVNSLSFRGDFACFERDDFQEKHYHDMFPEVEIKPEITQLLSQVFCTQNEDTITPPETQTYLKRTDYELQVGDGLCLSNLTEEQKVLLFENFDMYNEDTLNWSHGYMYWCNKVNSNFLHFVGCGLDESDLKNLITFDTLFNEVPAEAVDEDEPEVEVADKVKWVTANTSEGMMDTLLDYLTDGKDYKVVEDGGNWYLIVNDTGYIKSYHKSWFDTSYTVETSTQPEHIDTGFEGLVYVQPTVNSYIKPETMSVEQLKWFVDNVPFDEEMIARDPYLCYCAEHDQDWYFSDSKDGDTLTTFNEVFKESK